MSQDLNLSRRVDEVIERAVSEKLLVGAIVLIARDGTLIYEHAAGLTDRELNLPIQSDSSFRLASLSKTIVSAAALALVERKMISLDGLISHWLAEFRPQLAEGSVPAITIRHLLTHTAGFHYGFLQAPHGSYQSASISDGWDPVPAAGLGMEEQLGRIQTVPLSFVPGSRWQYSVAIDILGEIFSRASGMSLPEIVSDTVLMPLELKDSGFRVSDSSRLATPYAYDFPPRRMGDPEFVRFLENGICFSTSRVFRADTFYSGGGGMVGTASDYLTFLEMVRNGGGQVLA